MKRSFFLLALALAACTNAPSVVTAPLPVATTLPTTTVPAPIELTMQNCGAPPVTFSVLCETVELIETNSIHEVSRAELSAVATRAVNDYLPLDTVERPRGLVCAVPGEEFVPMCEAVVDQVEGSSPPIESLVEAAVTAILGSLPDPYNSYLPPSLVGSIGEDGIVPGIGIVVTALNNAGSHCVRIAQSCPLSVVTVIPGSPAENAGISDRSHISAVDGASVDGLSVSAVSALLAGEPGSQVVITVDGVDVSVVRGADEVVPLTGELVGSTGYLRLPEFGFESHILLHAYLEAFLEAGADQVVLDLRDNPGGYLFSASLVASEFVDEGTLLYQTQERAQALDFPAAEGGIGKALPLILVVNENSASAAEILAASLQEQGRALVVGTRTFGKNLVQLPFTTRNGGSVRLTIGTWTTAGGASVAGTGVVPDVVLELDPSLDPSTLVETVLAAA